MWNSLCSLQNREFDSLAWLLQIIENSSIYLLPQGSQKTHPKSLFFFVHKQNMPIKKISSNQFKTEEFFPGICSFNF